MRNLGVVCVSGINRIGFSFGMEFCFGPRGLIFIENLLCRNKNLSTCGQGIFGIKQEVDQKLSEFMVVDHQPGQLRRQIMVYFDGIKNILVSE
jgi:hypothetical protein